MCSFCTTPAPEVDKLISGPGIYICDRCVGLCVTILDSAVSDASGLPELSSMTDDELLDRLPRVYATVSQAVTGLDGYVRELRDRGISWARIGDSLGMTRQSAWERFRAVTDRPTVTALTTEGLPPAPPSASSMWRSRDFVAFWSGQSLSAFGNGVRTSRTRCSSAITGSPAAAGALTAIRALPYVLFGLVAGALADRWNRRRVMVVCDLGRAVNMATIPVAIGLDALTGAHLVITGFVGGLLYVFFSAAEAACLPNLVAAEQLPAAVSAQQASESAMGVIAGPIGEKWTLLQLGRSVPFAADAASFAGSALLLRFVHSDFRTGEPVGDTTLATDRSTLRRDIRAGVAWLWGHRPLRTISLPAPRYQTALSGVALVAIVIAHDAGASSGTIGVMFAGAGSRRGDRLGLPPGRLRDRLGAGRLLLAVLFAAALVRDRARLGANVVVVAVALAMFTVSMPCFGIVAVSYQLEVTPDQLRVVSAPRSRCSFWTGLPLGAGAAGLLVDAAGARTTAWSFVGWMSVSRCGRSRLDTSAT